MAKASRNGNECWSDPVALSHKWLLRNRITTLLDPARQISRAQPRYSAKGHHIFHITARFPAVIGD